MLRYLRRSGCQNVASAPATGARWRPRNVRSCWDGLRQSRGIFGRGHDYGCFPGQSHGHVSSLWCTCTLRETSLLHSL